MKKFVWIAVAVLVAAGIIGSLGDDGERTGDAPAAAVGDDEHYLDTLREVAPEARAYSDDLLISAAKEVCGALDRGADAFDLFAIAAEEMPDQAYLAGAIVGGAVIVYCPEHYDAVYDYVGAF